MQAAPASDSSLIDAGRRGDQGAFAQIVERYQHAVFGVAYATTRDRALADDVTQEAFVAAWRSLGELRDGTRLAGWLCGIARNRARDALKQRRRQDAREGAAVDCGAPPTPFDALSDAESERIVATALDAVPAVYREPLVLHYMEQTSVADIARQLGLDPGTTNKRLSRGRAQLAARVGELVEPRVRLRGPRPELAVGVLAAIAVLGATSHVDASPATAKGSTMLKLAASALVVAGVTGVSLLAAGGETVEATSRTSVSSRPAAASAQPRTATRGTARAPVSSRAAPVSVPRAATHAPARPQLPAAAVTVPDCATVGTHMAQLMFDEFPSAKQFPAAKRAKFIALRSESEAQKCALEKWSADRRQCLLGATDYDDKYACAEDGVATPDEVTSAPAELQCDAVAKHLAELTTAPGAKFDIIAKKLAQAGKDFDLDAARVQLATQTKLKCEEIPWSVSLRRCIANAKTHDQTGGCW